MGNTKQIVFLPGASGNSEFWGPVGELLGGQARTVYARYPTDKGATLSSVLEQLGKLLDRPSVVVAQSMGGILAVHLALQHPDLVTHLVLAATSGGVDLEQLGARDWRSEYPDTWNFPAWFVDRREDLSNEIQKLRQPTLLLWGESDPFSPVAVGRHLQRLLLNARLRVIANGDHDFANKEATIVADLIGHHIGEA